MSHVVNIDFTIKDLAGKQCQRLRQEYAAQVSTLQAARMGMRALRSQEADGAIKITLTR